MGMVLEDKSLFHIKIMKSKPFFHLLLSTNGKKITFRESISKILSQVKKLQSIVLFVKQQKIYFAVSTIGHLYLTLYTDANKKNKLQKDNVQRCAIKIVIFQQCPI